MLYGIFSINQICCISDFFKFVIAQTDWLIYLRKQFRGVEIRKCCACPWASHLKKVTCPDKILLVLFLFNVYKF